MEPQTVDGVKDLLVGGRKVYEIGGKSIVIKQVSLGKMKRAMLALRKEGADEFDILADYLFEVLSNDENPFVTRDWILENVTMPTINSMIMDTRKINGMGSDNFFQAGAVTASDPKKETRDLIEAPPTPSV